MSSVMWPDKTRNPYYRDPNKPRGQSRSYQDRVDEQKAALSEVADSPASLIDKAGRAVRKVPFLRDLETLNNAAGDAIYRGGKAVITGLGKVAAPAAGYMTGSNFSGQDEPAFRTVERRGHEIETPEPIDARGKLRALTHTPDSMIASAAAAQAPADSMIARATRTTSAPKPVVDAGDNASADIPEMTVQGKRMKTDAQRALESAVSEKDPEAKGDLRRALMAAGLNMMASNGDVWDAISQGGLAGLDVYDATRKRNMDEAEKKRRDRIDAARVGYELERDQAGDDRMRRTDARLDRTESRLDRSEARAAREAEAAGKQAERALEIQAQVANRPSAMAEIRKLEEEAMANPEGAAARTLDRYRPKLAKVDPAKAKWANQILQDPMASGVDKARAMAILGIETEPNDLDGLF